MAALLDRLPAPSRQYAPPPAAAPAPVELTSRITREAPPYGNPERLRYIPRKVTDFGDGGAYPEVHVAQFPLDMGKKDKPQGNQTLALTVDAEGGVNYSSILRQGRNKDKIIASEHSALIPKVDLVKQSNDRPEQEDIDKTTQETAAALNLVVNNKMQAAQPKTLPAQPGAPTYIKYTPSQQGPQYNSGASQRIIKMQDMPVDPMEPPKFRHKKVPRGTGSPPVPVMHSPPRPVTVKDQQDWKIPPCISNWKNAKGYTIPLDKRLAADGRGLQETQINDAFAKLTEALYVAEAKAREAVDMRSKVQRELLAKEKEKKEQELRELAMRARMDRSGAAPVPASERTEGFVAAARPAAEEEDLPGPPPRENESREEREERKRREEVRRDRAKERERERRLEARDAHGGKRSKLTRDRDRDISEKVALGQANVAGGGEPMYDTRLFNQEQGMASGLASEDNYNIYDKPMWADRGSNLYRPSAVQDDEEAAAALGGAEDVRTEKFRPDKGFKGTDYSAAGREARPSGPVQFERDPAEADPFGLDQFMNEVKAGKSKKR